MAHVRDLLENLEAELVAKLKALRDSMIPLERELADVRRARAAVAAAAQGLEQTQIAFPEIEAPEQSAKRDSLKIYLGSSFINSHSPYSALTIKDLIRKALSEQFEFGATANELLDFFSHAWGRQDIARTSLSPQLSRLKQDGEIVLSGQRWRLIERREEHPAPSDPRETAADL